MGVRETGGGGEVWKVYVRREWGGAEGQVSFTNSCTFNDHIHIHVQMNRRM